MQTKRNYTVQSAKNHFIKRAERYNRSSNWVSDQVLINRIYEIAEVRPEELVLDVAIGTGKIAESFYGRAKRVVGIDICIDMAAQAKQCADSVVLSRAERLSFKDYTFDICVCRQGLQFMEIEDALPEIHRVLKPKGRIILCHLAAYGEKDKETTFFIQKLRNPSRKNFFLPEDFPELLKMNNFTNLYSSAYISRESIDRWIDNGVLDRGEMEKIKNSYRNAPTDFKRIHSIQFDNGDIFDSMIMLIVKGEKDNK